MIIWNLFNHKLIALTNFQENIFSTCCCDLTDYFHDFLLKKRKSQEKYQRTIHKNVLIRKNVLINLQRTVT